MKKVNGDKGGGKKRREDQIFIISPKTHHKSFGGPQEFQPEFLDFIVAPSSSLLLIILFMKSFGFSFLEGNYFLDKMILEIFFSKIDI